MLTFCAFCVKVGTITFNQNLVGGTLVLLGRSRLMYDHRLTHPYNAEMEHVGFSPTRRAGIACIKRHAP